MNQKLRQLTITLTLLCTAGMLSGCHLDMWRQAKLKPYREFDFFADRSTMRPVVPNTVARGKMESTNPVLYTGRGADGKLVKNIPVEAVRAFESPKAMLLRGEDRYAAYCTPCHGKVGNGNGFIMQRGLGYWQKLAASYHSDRLRNIEDGHLYDVITNGYGVMYGYAARIQNVNDRWAIVAYIRALQLAQGTGGARTTEPFPRTASPTTAAGSGLESVSESPRETTAQEARGAGEAIGPDRDDATLEEARRVKREGDPTPRDFPSVPLKPEENDPIPGKEPSAGGQRFPQPLSPGEVRP
ncbi:MAG: hypothetical protein OHK0029_14770 [Armatimonadaceae bacterium]